MPDAFVATYFDGPSAAGQRVIARREHASLILRREGARGEVARWPLGEVVEFREEKDTGLLVLGCRNTDARLHVIGAGIIRDARDVLPGVRATGLPRRILKRAGLFSATVLGIAALILFVILPALATQIAAMIPPEREVQFGQMLRGQLEREFGADRPGGLICRGTKGEAALRAMTDRVMGRATVPYPLSVVVFDDDLVNAFALPGGHIVLFRGLIDAADHPDEVAAVLAHEIGHVAARDPVRLTLQSAGSAGLLGLVLGDFWGGMLTLGLATSFLEASYSQAAEAAADAYAHRRLNAAGLPPEALATMFERLREAHGDVDGFLGHFMSHPSLADRIEAARSAVVTHAHGAPSLDEAEWAALQTVCSG